MRRTTIALLIILATIGLLIARDQLHNAADEVEPPCQFAASPPTPSNITNAPCYVILHANAIDDQGNEAWSNPVTIHFVPTPTPTPTPEPTPTSTPTPTPTPAKCVKYNPRGKCLKWEHTN
jgi:hypothetical protein